MSIALFLIGLALPWVAGSGVLAATSRESTGPGHFAWLWGYGFFLGIASLCGLLLAEDVLLQRLRFVPVVLALAVVAAAAWTIAARTRYGSAAAVEATSPRPPGASRGIGRFLLTALLALSGIHVALSLLELLSQPLFPWDAWTVWAYRAKAWFFSGHLFEFVSKGDWLSGTDPDAYTQPALRYPWLPSLVPLWAALGLGRWHEVLINLPVFACGAAIALGVYGQTRRIGASPLVACVALYLLLSTPLFATHMSLGGYGDIWLAGFAGLGFVALMSATTTGRRMDTWVGIVLLAIGVSVKAEGFVWLLAGLLYVALTRGSWRWLLAAAVAGLAVLAGLVIFGSGTADIPGLGTVGYADGALYLPIKGKIPLQVNDILEPYLHNAFARGNWNLVWLGVLALLAATVFRSRRPGVRAAVTFFAVFAATQWLIFGFTSEGAWARDYTAINRLPLQVYPAVIFAMAQLLLALGADGSATAPRDGWGWRVPVVVVGGAMVTFLLLVSWIALEREAEVHEPVDLGPGALRFVVGEGRLERDAIVVSGFEDGVALLSSGPISLDAARFDLLRLQLDSDADADDPNQAPAFFWRKKGSEDSVARLALDGRSLVDLNASVDWEGEIVEIGFLFIETAGAPTRLGAAQLVDERTTDVLSLLPREWFQFERWSQRSANSRFGGAERQHAWLPVVILVFVLSTAALSAWLLPGRPRVLVAVFLLGWVLLDARWMMNRGRQATLSLVEIQLPVNERMDDPELDLYRPWLAHVRDDLLGEAPKRVLIVRDPDVHEYYAMRAKYQLLPHGAAVVTGLPGEHKLDSVGFVLFLGDYLPPRPPGAPPARRVERLDALPIPRSLVARFDLVELAPDAALFRISPPVRSGGE